jgi:5'-phosphate synthase pdxT subunit
VRTPADLAGIDGLVIPGGESTTMSRLLDTAGLRTPLAAMLADGLAVFGTCAGMILLARDVLDGQPEQQAFGVADVAVRRNGYGRQVDSFETDIDVVGLDHGPGVVVLASHEGVPVLLRQGRVVVASFHPELTDDVRLHGLFLDIVRSSLVEPTSAS